MVSGSARDAVVAALMGNPRSADIESEQLAAWNMEVLKLVCAVRSFMRYGHTNSFCLVVVTRSREINMG
jgi:hypothetical protein